MKRVLKGLAIAIVAGTICAAAAKQIAVMIALNPGCESTVLSEQKSPNGTFVFWVFERNCGATTGYTIGLSIRHAGDEFDQDARDDVFIMEGDVPATASWVDVDRIQVDVPKGAEVFRSEQEWEGVTISYVAD
ncbi:MAG: hypothetical protein HC869_05495 [Rhodospirillales bacterium]|nr:hypothetical protein [Rhodospirillales bacterium]